MTTFFWFRQGNPAAIMPWLTITIIWVTGGWLLATHAFTLERRERFMAGLGIGLVLYLWLANLLGHWLAPVWTFTLSGIFVLFTGILIAWHGQRPVLDWRDLQVWPQFIVGMVLAFVLTRIGEGLPLFDDHKNLSIISTMASGDIPPHFYMNSGFYFSYHYGFQLIGASLMRLGGMYPWSAFDFSKALVGAYLFLLAYLLSFRYLQNEYKAALVTLVFTFATGTRYLLLLLPQSIQATLNLEYGGEGVFVPLSELLRSTTSGPPISFPLAYRSGIVSWPRFMGVQAGPSTMALVVLFLAWLLASRSQRRYSFWIPVVIFSYWAMSWESTYSLFVMGGAFILLHRIRRNGIKGSLNPDLIALFLSIPIALIQGGTLTEILRGLIWGSPLDGLLPSKPSFAGFSLRWPPAIVSTQFGELSISSPSQLLVAFCEMGPVLLLAPWITLLAWRRFRQGDWILGALIVSAWVGFLAPIFLRYENDRDITRFPAHAVTVWTLVLAILVWDYAGLGEKAFKYTAATTLFLTAFGGVMIAGSALTASTQTVLSNIITPLDAQVSRDTWDRLPKNSEIFDSEKWRATALTGRLSHASLKTNVPSPDWERLMEDPSVKALLSSGYSYIYIDEEWWGSLSPEQKSDLSSTCIRVVSEHREKNLFRRLLELTSCQTTSSN